MSQHIDVSAAAASAFPTATQGFASVAFDGQYYWAGKWASADFIRLDMDGTFVDSFTIPGLTGTRGLTWDGTHLWAANNTGTLSRIDPATRTVVSTLVVPLAARYVAYDPAADGGAGGFWIGNFSTDILLVDTSGQVLQTLPAATIGLTGRYGLALDTTTEPEPFLWVFDQSAPSNATLAIIDLPEGTVRPGAQDLFPMIPGATSALAGGLYLSNGLQAGMPFLLALAQSSPNNALLVLNGVAPPPRTIGGTVSGLVGSGLVLQNNGGDDLAIAADGSFVFSQPVADGGAYAVTILAQPTGPSQTCSVADGSGTASGGDVTSVTVTCVTNSFTIGGTVTGLAAGNTVVLQNNGGDDLAVNANGAFTFAQPVDDGGSYAVTVSAQPSAPAQTCTVGSGSGTVATVDVTDITVTCVTDSFTIGGTLSGLAAGNSVVVQNNGGDDLALNANGGFTFPTAQADGSTYAVTVLTQPTAPNQSCVVGNGSGSLSGTDVGNVTITCSTVAYSIGGSVSGLDGGSVVLQLNGAETVVVGANGAFVFPTSLPDGSAYAVSVLTQPALPAPGQACSMVNGSGTIAGADITSVQVACANLADVPGAPTGVQGSTSDERTLTISWNAPDDNGAVITSYTVTVTPGGASCTTSGSPAPTQCVIGNLSPGTYAIEVVATNAAGTSLAGQGMGTVQILALAQPQVIPALTHWVLVLLASFAVLLAWFQLRRP